MDDNGAVKSTTIGLLDCEVRAERFPSFGVPSRALREGLSPGNHARIVLAVDGADPGRDIVHATPTGGFFRRPAAPTGERLWVKIVERRGLRYLGKVVNVPVLDGIRQSQHLEFGPEHVCGWDP